MLVNNLFNIWFSVFLLGLLRSVVGIVFNFDMRLGSDMF